MRFLHASDLHGNLDSFKAAQDIALSEKVDALFYTGDFLDQNKAMKEHEVERTNYLLRKCLKSEIKAVMQMNKIESLGGIDSLKELSKTRKDSYLTELINSYPALAHEAKVADERMELMAEDEKTELNHMLLDYLDEVEETAKSGYKAINLLFSKTVRDGKRIPVYAVFGNHDPRMPEALPNVQFVDEKPAVLKGLKIEGASGLTINDATLLPEQYASHLKEDVWSHQIDADDVQNSLREALNRSNIYQRLKDKQIDILLAHKGSPEFVSNGQGGEARWGWGVGTHHIIEEKKPILFCGHIHEHPIANEKGFRATNKKAHIVDFDEQTKKVKYHKTFDL